MLADELGNLQFSCSEDNRGLWVWVDRDNKSDVGERGVDGRGNGEGKEPVHSVPNI